MSFYRKKVFLLFATLFLLSIPVFFSALLAGSRFLTIQSLFAANPETVFLLKIRFMRIAASFTVGGSLALAGCVYQSVLRNPLAEPYILGVSSGASLGVALAFVTGAASFSVYSVPAFASAGAIILLAGVMVCGYTGKRTEDLLLAGVIGGTMASGLLVTILSFARSHELASVFWFLLGDFSATDPVLFRFFILFIPVICLILFFLAPGCNVLSLGNEYAWSMGVDPVKMTLLFTGLASLLAASSVALSGIIGFVGLIVPHILRKCSFQDNRVLFPASFAAGGIFLVLCDLVSRSIIPEREIPAGVITALIGGPLFLWILQKKHTGKGKVL